MSRIDLLTAARCVAIAAAAATTLSASEGRAQTALGTPFIGSNTLSFHTAEVTRSGGSETTQTFGVGYGHRFGPKEAATARAMVVRATARALDDSQAGVLDLAATIGVAHEITAIRGLSVAGATGLGMMAWGDDAARTGRLHLTIPANAGVSYDLRIRRATLSPFAMGTVAAYDVRTSVDDERESVHRGWDASYTTGVSLRLREVVMTTTRIAGEYGMPNRSRWTFAAGVSF